MIRIVIGIIIGMTAAAMAQNLSVTMTPAYLNALAHGITSSNE